MKGLVRMDMFCWLPETQVRIVASSPAAAVEGLGEFRVVNKLQLHA